MKDIEYFTIDKKKWERGEWDDEPDKVQFSDPATGYPCLIVRHELSGHLCGYVGVAKSNPAFEVCYDKVPAAPGFGYPEVHGGLTYSAKCTKDNRPQCETVCHEVEKGEDGDIWWLGFDCAHSGDKSDMGYSSSSPSLFSTGIYRNIDYVKSECARLAEQLRALVK